MDRIVPVALIMLILGLFVFLATSILCVQVGKLFQRRVSNITIGMIGLVLFFIGKYIWYIIDLASNAAPIQVINIQIDYSFWNNLLVANVAMASFPDLILLLLSLALVFDRSKTFTKIIAPYGLFFGLVYLFCSTFNYVNGSYVDSFNLKWYEFIFIGDGMTRMPSLTYIYVIFISTVSIISSKEYSRWSIASSLIFGVLIIVYSVVLQIYKNVGANALTYEAFVGLGQNLPVTNGSYFANYFFEFGKALGINLNTMNDAWKGPLTIYCMLIGVLILTFLLKNLFTRDIRRVNFIYYPWYHRSKLFKTPCAMIDAGINNFLYNSLKIRAAYLFGIQSKDLPLIYSYYESLNENDKKLGDVDPTKVNELAENLNKKKEKDKAKRDKLKAKREKQIRKSNKNKYWDGIDYEKLYSFDDEQSNQSNNTKSIKPDDDNNVGGEINLNVKVDNDNNTISIG